MVKTCGSYPTNEACCPSAIDVSSQLQELRIRLGVEDLVHLRGKIGMERMSPEPVPQYPSWGKGRANSIGGGYPSGKQTGRWGVTGSMELQQQRSSRQQTAGETGSMSKSRISGFF